MVNGDKLSVCHGPPAAWVRDPRVPVPTSCCEDPGMAPATQHSVPAFRPLNLQIKGLLIKSLEAGEWRPAESIPSEIELATRFRVSQGTVRKAIDALAGDNLVIRRQGKGTFVATHTQGKNSMFRFLRIPPNDRR